MTEHDTDVLIIGAGMTGSCLARQLRLQQPTLRIMNIDRRTTFSHWIGESTVEAWEDYLSRVLGLGGWLEEEFFEKHGLRMFFDSPNKDLSLEQMSEFGRSRHHPVPARHIDRTRFDAMMVERNRAEGIDVRLGVAVARRGIELDAEAGHRVETNEGVIRCRWLIDASGWSSLLANQLDLLEKPSASPKSSYWVRLRGCRHIDDFGDEAWKARTNGTRRQLSTNHFLYHGYWFWHIALTEDIVSIGIEFDSDSAASLKFKDAGELIEFMRSHRCLRDILGERFEVIDFGALKNLSHISKAMFSADRWCLAGMSGFFAEVMGSGTSRVYAETNRIIGELIAADLGGDARLLERRVAYCNSYIRSVHRSFSRNLGRYQWYGSFDVFAPYFVAGLAIYFNRQLPNCMTDLEQLFEHLDALSPPDGIEVEAFYDDYFARRDRGGLRTATYRIAGELYELLRAEGRLYDGNTGRFLDSIPWEARPDIMEKWYQKRVAADEAQADARTHREFLRRVTARACEVIGVTFDEEVFAAELEPDWSAGQTLAQLIEAMRTRLSLKDAG